MGSVEVYGNSLRVMSHALPTPSADGHAFPALINHIIERVPSLQTTWINVFHAVPGRFNLQDLPTIPPNTPGSSIGGEDYFTSKVFDTAVPVSDYDGPATALPQSFRPVVPPGSIHVSIIERYIPPPTPNEATTLFDRTGLSLINDRLVELSPTNGLLLFVYPTKTGARTFMSDYLGPVLEPHLRSMAIVNELSADLGTSLHRMASVDHLIDFGELKASMEHFCRQLSTTNESLSRFHPERNTTYHLVHASKEEVMPARRIWAADWWSKQEKPRLRSTVTKYFRQNQKAQDTEIVPTALIQGILDGVSFKSNPEGRPDKGIEVGVFVVKKSLLNPAPQG